MKKNRWVYDDGVTRTEAVDVDGYPIHQFAYQPSSRYDFGWPLQVVTAGSDIWCRGCERVRFNSPILAVELVLEGQFHFEQNGVESICGPGEVFLVRPGSDTAMRYHQADIGRKLVMEITGPLLGPLVNLMQLHRINAFQPTNADWLIQRHDQARKILEEGKPDYMRESSLLAYDVLTSLGRSAGQNRLPIAVRQAISLMEHRITSSVGLQELCDYTQTSQPTLHRLFAKHLGEAPINYYLNLKIQTAKTSILAPGASIKSVAAEFGYDNPQYFSALFKKRTGMSPQKYRQQHRSRHALTNESAEAIPDPDED